MEACREVLENSRNRSRPLIDPRRRSGSDKLNENVYRIVMGRFGRALPRLPRAQLGETLLELFLQDGNWRRREIVAEEIPRFTAEELEYAFTKLRPHESMGPDGFTAKAMKVIVEASPMSLLEPFNQAICRESIPMTWNAA